jgi:hypothetical protein
LAAPKLAARGKAGKPFRRSKDIVNHGQCRSRTIGFNV